MGVPKGGRGGSAKGWEGWECQGPEVVHSYVRMYMHDHWGTNVELVNEPLGLVESVSCVSACLPLGSVVSASCVSACLLHLTRALTVLTSPLFNLKLCHASSMVL